MAKNSIHQINTNRRGFIKTAAGLSLIPITASLWGCGETESVDISSGTQDSSDTSSGSDGSTSDYDNWASGGTASMYADFPDDSLFDTAGVCTVALTGSQTEGPCYFQSSYLDDISFEQTGLPMMLCLQLTDENCNPLSGYEIEVWHCDVNGLYSGDTSSSADSSRFNSSFCTGNNSGALNSAWFRGIGVTDSSGRINLKSCFPGWYSSRAIHVHFRIRNNNNDQLISQFGFEDSFCNAICANHVDYSSRGEPDTLLGQDTVFGSDYNDYLFNVIQNDDGSLLAYKRIMVTQ